MRPRRVADRIGIVLRRAVVHAGALKMVSGAHRMLRHARARERLRPITESRKGYGPGAWVAIPDVPESGEDLANGSAHVVCFAEAAEELEVHLRIGEAANPRRGPGDAILIGCL